MEKLADKARIHQLLQRLIDKRTLLSVVLKDKKEPYTSAILELNRDEGYLILDELKPEEGDKVLRNNPSLYVGAHLDGVNVRFSATVSEFGRDNNIPFYKLVVPSKIEYHQRRQAVRVKLSAATPVPVTFATNEGKAFSGEVEDISVGGLRARFKHGLPQTLKSGTKLKCSFFLPPDNEEKLSCELIVRAIKHDKDKFKPPFLGGEFLGIEKPMERLLQRAVMSLQRASRQKDIF